MVLEHIRNRFPHSCKYLCLSVLAVFIVAPFPTGHRVAASQESAPTTTPAIKLSLIATDSAHHALDELSKENIQVSEDGVPQTVLLFSKDERPVYFGLAIDTSGSFAPVLGSVVAAAKVIINSNRPDDETFIETFISSDKIDTQQEFTAEKEKLLKSFATLHTEGGQSAVVDGIYVAAEHTAKYGRPDHRRALVLITDGEERNSFYKVSALEQLLRETDVQVFAIGIVSKLDDSTLISQSPREKAERLLRLVAEETGGRVFFPKNMKELIKAANEIAHDLHSQFMVTYQPASDSGKQGFHKVAVRLATAPGQEKLNAITRPGYWVGVAGPKSKGKKKETKSR